MVAGGVMRKSGVAFLLCCLLACASPSSGEVRLSWDAVPGDDIVGYNVYRTELSGQGYRRINSDPVPQPSYTDGDVQRGKTYYYRVTTVNAAGLESEFSEERSKTVD